jgi:hypothetical protein
MHLMSMALTWLSTTEARAGLRDAAARARWRAQPGFDRRRCEAGLRDAAGVASRVVCG